MGSREVSIFVNPLPLKLAQPFRISHGTSTERTNALIHLDGAVGEAALPPYYPYSVDDIREYVAGIELSVPDGIDWRPEALVDQLPAGPPPAIAAIDMALFDLWGRRHEQPLYQLLGFDPLQLPVSSFALSIPFDLKEQREIVRSLYDWPFLKLKLGSGDIAFDEAVVRETRACYHGQLCVDANAGWTRKEALKIIPVLAGLNLEFVEQPVGIADVDAWYALKRDLPDNHVSLIADESVRSIRDLETLAGAIDGVNLKLAKCGGIRSVLLLMELARANSLSVMIGCMIESSLALTAAAHIAPSADYLDLDGLIHLQSDPYRGMEFDRGLVRIPESPGLGVEIR